MFVSQVCFCMFALNKAHSRIFSVFQVNVLFLVTLIDKNILFWNGTTFPNFTVQVQCDKSVLFLASLLKKARAFE